METNINHLSQHSEPSVTYQVWVWLYALASYGIGVAGLSVLVLALAGFIPLGGVLIVSSQPTVALVINIGLVLLFGLQHSSMARPTFKQRFAKVLPQALERASFVWASGAVLAIAVLLWQPMPGVIYASEGLVNLALWAGFVFGWLYLLGATFAINHFDLFGLRQAWFEARGEQYVAVPFKENWMYRYSRHPIMLGALIGLWCVPTMTVTSLSLSLGMALYIVVGLWFEERDLIRHWGQAYLDYKKRVRALF